MQQGTAFEESRLLFAGGQPGSTAYPYINIFPAVMAKDVGFGSALRHGHDGHTPAIRHDHLFIEGQDERMHMPAEHRVHHPVPDPGAGCR